MLTESLRRTLDGADLGTQGLDVTDATLGCARGIQAVDLLCRGQRLNGRQISAPDLRRALGRAKREVLDLRHLAQRTSVLVREARGRAEEINLRRERPG